MKSLSKILALFLILTIAFGGYHSNAQAAAAISGTYKNTLTGEILRITKNNDTDGSLSGTITSGGKTLNVKGSYHFLKSVENPTTIQFIATSSDLVLNPDPETSEAWAGTGNAKDFAELNLLGIRSTLGTQRGSNTLKVLGRAIQTSVESQFDRIYSPMRHSVAPCS